MKVNNNGSAGRPGGIAGPQDVTGARPAQPSPAPARSGGGDRVDITSLSSQLQALESRLTDVSVVDSARVESIKQAIAEGRFNVNSEVVADRLIATVREYLLSQRS